MDKILLTAFLSALAGLISFILSIVKLVNDKESNTTDYRQSWTDSVRESLADLISKINIHASETSHLATVREKLAEQLSNNSENQQSWEVKVKDLFENSFKESSLKIRESRKELYQAYSFTRLHFKPNDISFNRIEQKFDVVMTLLQELSEASKDKAERATLKEKVHATADEITGYARDILKCEWEIVKRGEPAYQRTKRLSLWSGAIMLLVIFAIGIHAGFSYWRASIIAESAQAAIK